MTIETPSFREIEQPLYPPLHATLRKRQRRRSQRLLEREDDDVHDEGDDEHHEHTSSEEEESEEEPPRRQQQPVCAVAFTPQTAKLARLAKRMGMQTPELNGNTALTHVIVSGKEPSDTYELLCGLACGAKLVSGEWLAACNQRGGKAVRAGKYLVYQCPEMLRKKARRPLLFAGGTRVHVSVGKQDEDQVKALVRFAGGALVDTARDCEVCITNSASRRKHAMDVAAFKQQLLDQQVKM